MKPYQLVLVVGIILLAVVLGPVWPSHGDEIYRPKYSSAPTSRSANPTYSFAPHPLHNPLRLFAKYQPLVELINERVHGFSLKLVASRDYSTFESRLYARRFQFALPNPLQTLISQSHGYRIVGKMGDDFLFRGIIIMRRDSQVMFVEDLANASLSFPAPTALAATMMPKYFLQTRGLQLSSNDIRYVGSQESAIMNVYLGKTTAAGTWPVPWELLLETRPELGKVLEVKWMTPTMVNNGLVARDDVPPDHVRQVMQVLFTLNQSQRGRDILSAIHLSCFEPATAATYEVVKTFLKEYYRVFADEQQNMVVPP